MFRHIHILTEQLGETIVCPAGFFQYHIPWYHLGYQQKCRFAINLVFHLVLESTLTKLYKKILRYSSILFLPLSHSAMKLDDPFYEDFLSRPTLHKYHIILHGMSIRFKNI